MKSVRQAFNHDILAHDNSSACKVWFQMVQWFRRYYLDMVQTSENLHPHCDFDHEESNPNFLHATLPCGNVSSHKVCLAANKCFK